MMNKGILDLGQVSNLSEEIVATFDGQGFTAEEIIPALVRAIVLFAAQTVSDEQAIDEAVDLLVDGFE